jgi:hypothetical protein
VFVRMMPAASSGILWTVAKKLEGRWNGEKSIS